MFIHIEKGRLSYSVVTGKWISAGICVFLLVGCTTMLEKSIYPADVTSKKRSPSIDVVERAIQASIDLPVDVVWEALLTVINQHAFIWHIDASDPGHRELSYSDVRALLMQDKPVQVSLPYTVILYPEELDSTKMIVNSRWDLITDENYRKNHAERFTDLKFGMETEAYILTQRTATQAAGGSAWVWLKEEDRK